MQDAPYYYTLATLHYAPSTKQNYPISKYTYSNTYIGVRIIRMQFCFCQIRTVVTVSYQYTLRIFAERTRPRAS